MKVITTIYLLWDKMCLPDILRKLFFSAFLSLATLLFSGPLKPMHSSLNPVNSCYVVT